MGWSASSFHWLFCWKRGKGRPSCLSTWVTIWPAWLVCRQHCPLRRSLWCCSSKWHSVCSSIHMWNLGCITKTPRIPLCRDGREVVWGIRKGKANNTYNSRALRWANIKKTSNKRLSKVIDIEEKINFRPYTYSQEFLRFNFIMTINMIYPWFPETIYFGGLFLDRNCGARLSTIKVCIKGGHGKLRSWSNYDLRWDGTFKCA